MKRIALAVLLLPAFGAVAFAQPAPGCTRETLSVRGTALNIGYCLPPGPAARSGSEASYAVSETYGTARGSFSQTSNLSFIAGDDPSRVIEDVDLAKVGLSGTLHLTLVMRKGAIHIESAMLTPGAITIK